MVKVLSDAATDRILGVHIIGSVSWLEGYCDAVGSFVCSYTGSR